MRYAKGDLIEMRLDYNFTPVPAVVIIDQGGTNLLVKPMWRNAMSEQRSIRRHQIVGASERYKVSCAKGRSGPSADTSCASLAAAMEVVSEAMGASPAGETVDRLSIRSASGYQVFTATYEADNGGWMAFDDRAFRR